MSSPAQAFHAVAKALDSLRIPFLVGGSLASSVHGLPRTTLDIDIVADLRPDQVEALAAALQGEFYADADQMREALERGRAFNVIHLASAYKVDVFPVAPSPYGRTQFERRQMHNAELGGETVAAPFATAEDTILNKLLWYHAGGGVSDRQWHDVRGIVEVSGSKLDMAYLRHWAAHLRVSGLLEEALSESAT